MADAMILQCSSCKKEWNPTDMATPWQQELCPIKHRNPTGWYRTKHSIAPVMIAIPNDVSGLC